MTKQHLTERERYEPKDRDDWREWLSENHETSKGVWLIYNKKAAGKSSVTYAEAVEEALCFGWIDSLPRKLDETRVMLWFSPRKPGSPWSRLNKTRPEKLIPAGLMTNAGMAKIEAAKKDGSWTSYDDVEDLIIPDDLNKALAANQTARDYFEKFNDSSKKGIIWYLLTTKNPETRAKRVKKVVSMAEMNKRAGTDKE